MAWVNLGKIGGNTIIESPILYSDDSRRRLDTIYQDWDVDYGDWLCYWEGVWDGASASQNNYTWVRFNDKDTGFNTGFNSGGYNSPVSGACILEGVSRIEMRGDGNYKLLDNARVLLIKLD